jgi:hypothetical protein
MRVALFLTIAVAAAACSTAGDPGAPAAEQYWCSMHPDVRAPDAGTCPRCGMPLVPMPPFRPGDYQMSTSFAPSGPNRGVMTIAITDPDTGEPVRDFVMTHERLLHLFVISRDLAYFAHVHPAQQPEGVFVQDLEVPRADMYVVAADFVPSGGTPQMLQTFWTTPDFRGAPFPDARGLAADLSAQPTGPLRVSIGTRPMTAGQTTAVTISVSDARTGAPVTDLQPYLGAAGHLVVASADLATILHSHPVEPAGSGPDVTFDVVFPRAGRYKMWGQFQRGGEVHTASFVVDVGGA